MNNLRGKAGSPWEDHDGHLAKKFKKNRIPSSSNRGYRVVVVIRQQLEISTFKSQKEFFKR